MKGSLINEEHGGRHGAQHTFLVFLNMAYLYCAPKCGRLKKPQSSNSKADAEAKCVGRDNTVL